MYILREIIAGTAGVLAFVAYVPYLLDIFRGRVLPARSTRVMFAILLSIVTLQQIQLGARLTLAVTLGEWLGSVILLLITLRHGHGGLRRIDIVCYVLLAVDLLLWLGTGSALLALFLSIIADVIAFTPTLHKTWLHPRSETPMFYLLGVVAALLNLLVVPHLTLAIALYPLALAIENAIELMLIYRRGLTDDTIAI